MHEVYHVAGLIAVWEVALCKQNGCREWRDAIPLADPSDLRVMQRYKGRIAV